MLPWLYIRMTASFNSSPIEMRLFVNCFGLKYSLSVLFGLAVQASHVLVGLLTVCQRKPAFTESTEALLICGCCYWLRICADYMRNVANRASVSKLGRRLHGYGRSTVYKMKLFGRQHPLHRAGSPLRNRNHQDAL